MPGVVLYHYLVAALYFYEIDIKTLNFFEVTCLFLLVSDFTDLFRTLISVPKKLLVEKIKIKAIWKNVFIRCNDLRFLSTIATNFLQNFPLWNFRSRVENGLASSTVADFICNISTICLARSAFWRKSSPWLLVYTSKMILISNDLKLEMAFWLLHWEISYLAHQWLHSKASDHYHCHSCLNI